MAWRDEFAAVRIRWSLLTFYQKFEHGVITLLTVLIAFVIALAVWNLMLKVVNSVIYANFDPTDYEVFQYDLHGDHRARVLNARCWLSPNASNTSCKCARLF
jgi:hypothetical protein